MDNISIKTITSQGIDKTAIKNFAVYARSKLIKDIKNKAAMIGVTERGIQDSLSTSTGNIQLFDIGMQEPYRIEGKAIAQRNGLIRELEKRAQGSTYLTAYQTLIEEVAYTWFNRIIAIRFMEVNNYMPDRMRILSSGVAGINEPEFITHVFETNFEFSEEEKKHIIELKTDGSNLAMGELFQHLFIKQCNILNVKLPELFEKTNDYTELLLTVSYNDIEGVIYKLVHEVPETNFDVNSDNGNGQVEIIGWLYQFYNTEPKATVFSRPKSKKIEKQDIPAATQLFTPEWIVKYMVENSLGRLWVEKLLANDDSRTEKQIADDFGWKYYLPEAEQDERVRKQLENLRNERKYLSVENVRFLDPAMGSFHIGIYAFDVYMQLYESEGYTTREAARLIVEKNLHGLDIDKRAAQLSYFTSMMQARKYNRRILEGNLQPNVYEIPESNHINREHLNYLGNDIEDKEEWDRLNLQLVSLLNIFIDAKEYGSLMNISYKYDFPQLRKFVMSHSVDSQISLLETLGLEETEKELLNIINVAEIISRKYLIVITNPPYMGSSGMDKKLSDFAKKYYADSKSDMFAMFIEKCKNYTIENGYFSMITQQAWMFLSSYEKLRSKLLESSLVNMAHLGARAFEEIGGEVVQTTSFVYLNNYFSNYKGKYIKLTEFDSQAKKEVAYVSIFDVVNRTYVYENYQENFKGIPGIPIAYWASKNIFEIFEEDKLYDLSISASQNVTGNNNKYLRFFWEVDSKKINKNIKWIPYAKGGGFRKWYGNIIDVIDWTPESREQYRKGHASQIIPEQYWYKKGITWGLITSNTPSFRVLPSGSTFDKGGSSIFIKNETHYNYIMAVLNSNVFMKVFEIMNPTLNFQVNDVRNIPIIIGNLEVINSKVSMAMELSKNDWDSYEQSMDFHRDPLVRSRVAKDKNTADSSILIKSCFEAYKKQVNHNYYLLKTIEEDINRLLVSVYNLQNEVSFTVRERDVTITKILDDNSDEDKGNKYFKDKKEVIINFISYAIGCIFGRYSLDSDGVVHAGGFYDEIINNKIEPDLDNIILVSDDEYNSYDIVSKFVSFVRTCFGVEVLEENLTFIAESLGHRGLSSREVIRNYFVNDFYKNHLKTYKKRPIYWLYDSGKQNGFKALVYMHRYDEDTTGKVRVDYLHQVQRAYERTIANLQEDIANSNDAKETIQLQKRLEKVTKQLKECRDYDERLGHMALERVAIDLDDGVKVNYEKVQTDSKGEFHQILAKIK